MKTIQSLTLWLLILSLLVCPLTSCQPKDPTPSDTTPPAEDQNPPENPPETEEPPVDIPAASLPDTLTVAAAKTTLMVGESIDLDANVSVAIAHRVTFEATAGAECVRIEDDRIFALSEGEVTLIAKIGTLVSDPITLTVTAAVDPYEGMTADQFYANYTPAVSYLDATLRAQHGFMSGELTVPDQAPTVSEYQPQKGDQLIRNRAARYEDDGNTYVVVDAYGEEVMEIYRGGAYITLEEVAAYVFAFGGIPANHSESKKTKPNQSVWGIYLRVNHTKFTGDTAKYPYEPELPNISGCGGSFQYYEIDIGTTGNDCDPSYRPALYNNGVSITRGASRIVYARMDVNGNKIIEPDEKFVFYTYNHYNDFQEYLNYFGGWGEMFGNITGGGKISSKTDCNPTPYVPTYRGDLSEADAVTNQTSIAVWLALPAGLLERKYA